MITPVKIQEKIIGKEHPTFIIAEMACAHQGDVENACKLVEVAAKAKTDAIQIQVFKKEVYMNPIYKDWNLAKQLELSHEEWSRIIDKIKEHNLLFFAAGYDIESIKFLIEKDVKAFKIHSADTSNPEILKEVAKSKKPIFLSCGASKIDEIKRAIKLLRKHGAENLILMHGYQGFPTRIEDSHLSFIRTLEKIFNLNVGFYDHVDGGSYLAKIIPIMAIGYGAQVIEKHFILSREEKGIDYESSLDPKNFKNFINLLRESEKAIGTEEIREFTAGELNYRAYCKKAVVAMTDIKKGTEISRDKVAFLRSDPGIPPDEFNNIEGKIAKKDIRQYKNLTYDDF